MLGITTGGVDAAATPDTGQATTLHTGTGLILLFIGLGIVLIARRTRQNPILAAPLSRIITNAVINTGYARNIPPRH